MTVCCLIAKTSENSWQLNNCYIVSHAKKCVLAHFKKIGRLDSLVSTGLSETIDLFFF